MRFRISTHEKLLYGNKTSLSTEWKNNYGWPKLSYLTLQEPPFNKLAFSNLRQNLINFPSEITLVTWQVKSVSVCAYFVLISKINGLSW